MNNPVEAFNFEGQNVRTTVIDNEPWFVLSDVCKVLEIANVGNAKKRLDQADIHSMDVWSEANNRSYLVTTVNESGLYDVILDSRKPQAKAFRRWITSDVIPSIRKHGVYVTEEVAEEGPDVLMAKALLAAKDTLDKQEARIAGLENTVEEMEPMARLGEIMQQSEDTITIGDLAKLLNTRGLFAGGRTKLYHWLREEGYLMKMGTAGHAPTQRYINQGLFDVAEDTFYTDWGAPKVSYKTTVTTKGQRYFIEEFQSMNALLNG